MLHTVEVHLGNENLSTTMSAMRTWLDNRRVEPDVFRYEMTATGTVVRVNFKVESEAAAFAQAFPGALIDGKADEIAPPKPTSSAEIPLERLGDSVLPELDMY